MERRASRLMRRVVPIAVLVVAMAVPASAQGPAILYDGTTSQERRMRLWATPDGDITEIRMWWRAPCRRGGFVRTGTRYLDPIEQSGTEVTDSGRYRDPEPGPISLVISGRLAGTFENGRGGEGTARYWVSVRRRGRQINTCRTGRLTWSVARSG